jgi:putative ABC transport system substrate-binding protein
MTGRFRRDARHVTRAETSYTESLILAPENPMRRRDFITLVGGAAVAWPLAARAQQTVPVIGYLSSLTQADSLHFDAAFRGGLSELGYVEDQNVLIEYRWITDRYDPLPAMAADLVQRQVSVIAAFGPPAVLAAMAATATIPIVFVTGADPIKFGFVASFNRPGGNITGIWMVTTVLAEKRLQLVREMVPKAELVALLINPTSPVAEPQTRDAQAAARALGLKLSILNAVTEKDFDQVFMTLGQQGADWPVNRPAIPSRARTRSHDGGRQESQAQFTMSALPETSNLANPNTGAVAQGEPLLCQEAA